MPDVQDPLLREGSKKEGKEGIQSLTSSTLDHS